MRDFTKKISHREMTFFLLPIILVNIFQQISGIAGTVVMNRLLSPEVITTISACRIYPMLQRNLIGAAATGFGVYVTRYIGKNNREDLRKAITQALTGTALLTLASLCLLFVLNPLLGLVNIPADIFAQAKEYLRWLFAGTGALVFLNLFLGILYGLGESAFAGGVSSVGVILQPILTFFYVRNGDMEISADPIASMTNRLLQAVILLGYLLWKYKYLFGGPLRHETWVKECRALWKCGFSGALMFLFTWVGTLLIQRQVNLLSAADISAYMYAVLVEDMLLIPIWSVKDAGTYIIAQNAGAKKKEQLNYYFRRLCRQGFLFCLVIFAVIRLWAPECVRLIVGPDSEAVIDKVCYWLRTCAFAFPALFMSQIGRVSLQAVGAYRTMSVLGIIEGALRILLALFVIAGRDFHALVWAFFSIFIIMGIASGIGVYVALKRMEEENLNG